MLSVVRYLRGCSRLMIGLFAMQCIVASFCLITPVVHASDIQMPSASALNFDAACEKSTMTTSDHADPGMVCTHCDLPNELISSFAASPDVDTPAALLIEVVDDVMVSSHIDLNLRPSTGPPQYAPLFYHNNQRILI